MNAPHRSFSSYKRSLDDAIGDTSVFPSTDGNTRRGPNPSSSSNDGCKRTRRLAEDGQSTSLPISNVNVPSPMPNSPTLNHSLIHPVAQDTDDSSSSTIMESNFAPALGFPSFHPLGQSSESTSNSPPNHLDQSSSLSQPRNAHNTVSFHHPTQNQSPLPSTQRLSSSTHTSNLGLWGQLTDNSTHLSSFQLDQHPQQRRPGSIGSGRLRGPTRLANERWLRTRPTAAVENRFLEYSELSGISSTSHPSLSVTVEDPPENSYAAIPGAPFRAVPAISISNPSTSPSLSHQNARTASTSTPTVPAINISTRSLPSTGSTTAFYASSSPSEVNRDFRRGRSCETTLRSFVSSDNEQTLRTRENLHNDSSSRYQNSFPLAENTFNERNTLLPESRTTALFRGENIISRPSTGTYGVTRQSTNASSYLYGDQPLGDAITLLEGISSGRPRDISTSSSLPSTSIESQNTQSNSQEHSQSSLHALAPESNRSRFTSSPQNLSPTFRSPITHTSRVSASGSPGPTSSIPAYTASTVLSNVMREDMSTSDMELVEAELAPYRIPYGTYNSLESNGANPSYPGDVQYDNNQNISREIPESSETSHGHRRQYSPFNSQNISLAGRSDFEVSSRHSGSFPERRYRPNPIQSTLGLHSSGNHYSASQGSSSTTNGENHNFMAYNERLQNLSRHAEGSGQTRMPPQGSMLSSDMHTRMSTSNEHTLFANSSSTPTSDPQNPLSQMREELSTFSRDVHHLIQAMNSVRDYTSYEDLLSNNENTSRSMDYRDGPFSTVLPRSMNNNDMHARVESQPTSRPRVASHTVEEAEDIPPHRRRRNTRMYPNQFPSPMSPDSFHRFLPPRARPTVSVSPPLSPSNEHEFTMGTNATLNRDEGYSLRHSLGTSRFSETRSRRLAQLRNSSRNMDLNTFPSTSVSNRQSQPESALFSRMQQSAPNEVDLENENQRNSRISHLVSPAVTTSSSSPQTLTATARMPESYSSALRAGLTDQGRLDGVRSNGENQRSSRTILSFMQSLRRDANSLRDRQRSFSHEDANLLDRSYMDDYTEYPMRRHRYSLLDHELLRSYRGGSIAANPANYMSEDELDTSYEGLLSLSERIGYVKPKGINKDALNQLPTFKYSEWDGKKWRLEEGIETKPTKLRTTKNFDISDLPGSCSNSVNEGKRKPNVLLKHPAKSMRSNNYSSTANGTRDNREKSCSICLDNYKDNDILMGMKCGHVLHRDCLANWLQRNNTCPLCRDCPA